MTKHQAHALFVVYSLLPAVLGFTVGYQYPNNPTLAVVTVILLGILYYVIVPSSTATESKGKKT